MYGHQTEKERRDVINSYAVEINTYLEGKRQFLTDAQKLSGELTGKERLRLYGAGVKNYGLIEKAYDIASENPDYMPPHLDIDGLRDSLIEFDHVRQLVFELEQYLRAAENAALLESDAHYHSALRIYSSLKEQARNGVAGADALFKALQPFFRRRKRNGEADGQLTAKQAERKAKKLIQGKAEGEIHIKNIKPRAEGGAHEVVISGNNG